MKSVVALFVCSLIWSCGERPDELTPYVEKVKPLEKYHTKLKQYRTYLKTEGMTSMAKDIRQVIEAYKADLAAVGIPKDKYMRAAHNNMVRALDRSLTQLVQPDFPTFVPSATKQISRIEKAVVRNYYYPLSREWEKAGKTEPFPLAWGE